MPIYTSILAAMLLSLGPSGAEPTLINVSPTGDDQAKGDAAHPLATPQGARNRIRAIKAEHDGTLPGPVTVQFGAGLYTLTEPFVLEPQDSGTADTQITYRAAPGAQVVLSGGQQLPPWHAATLDGRNVWATEYRPAPPPQTLRELWVGGQRRVRARHPNSGYLQIENVPEVPKGATYRSGQKQFRFRESDAALWKGVDPGAEILAFTRWISTRMVVDKVEAEPRIARCTQPALFLFQPGDIYILEGQRAFLDAPGEWWHDEKAGTIYYIPEPAETIESAAPVVPRLSEVLVLAGDPANAQPVHDIAFEGLTFSHATWWFPAERSEGPTGKPDPMASRQAAFLVPAAIHADGARHIAFQACTISHVGGYGVELARGCTDNALTRCTITDLGAGGIKIGEPTIREAEPDRTARNTVSDCTITDGGHLHHEGVGVWIGQSDANTIEHNRIADFDYTGISIGWTWGYGPARAGGNIVRFNDVGPIGTHPIPGSTTRTDPPLGDLGGIYTLGTQPGTVISNNLFHDIRGHSIAWGIYFDEGTTGVVAERNVVMHTSHGSFHQHYGKDNLVRNNLFIDPGIASLWRTKREDHHTLTIERNVIVVGPAGAAFHNDWSGDQFSLSNNVYLYTDTPPIFPGKKSLEEWQRTGQDKDSSVARIDGQIAENPPALAERYPDCLQTIDLHAFGPRR